MKAKIRKVKYIAASLNTTLRELNPDLEAELTSAIRELDIEIDYYMKLIRSITKNIKEIYESERINKTKI